MQNRSRLVEIVVWSVLGLTIVSILVVFARNLTRPKAAALPVLGEVPAFSLTNQQNRVVGNSDLSGQVWIANIIFTRCPGPCTQITQQMADLQGKLSPKVKFVSLSADPGNDTPPVLSAYAQLHGADAKRWHFLTGPKPEINSLAITGLKLALLDKEEMQRESPNDLFIHSTLFALVDGRGRLRGFYEALEQPAMQRLEAEVATLLKE